MALRIKVKPLIFIVFKASANGVTWEGMGALGRKTSKRILAIKLRAIGDTVLLTGPLRLLKQSKPDHELHVLVRSPAGELLEGLPFIDRSISVKEPQSLLDRTSYWARHIRNLREKYYGQVLVFHSNFKSALVAKSLRSELVVTNNHDLKGRNWFSSLPVPNRGLVKPIIDRDLDVLRAIGLHPKVEDALPQLKLYPAEKELAEKELKSTGSRIIFLGIGASRETKRWASSHFIELMKGVPENFRFLICTTPGDTAWVGLFLDLLKEEKSILDRLIHLENRSLREVASLISRCSAYVGNDSGLKHVAAALGVPTVSIFGPEGPLEWHPYSKEQHPYFFREELACRTETGKHWCPIATCEKYQTQCMVGVPPGPVLAALLGVLN